MDVIREINNGGYGVVFEAKTEDGSVVALKVFRPEGKHSDDELARLRKRFVREVKTQAFLAKYGTLPILDSGLADDPPWFTMPMADLSYRAQIDADRSNGKISAEPLADILNCLDEIHQRGFVHRDLKPENILRLDGRWYLADLGLAMALDVAATTKLTTVGSAYGSPRYMAPEQMLDFSHVTKAADIFSFGCILHDLVDGGARTPFATASTPANPKWDPIVRKCTAYDPAKRFNSIAALRSVLTQTLRKHGDLSQTPATLAWAAELQSIASWESDKFQELASSLEGEKPGAESGILSELTAEHFECMRERNVESWFRTGAKYAAWMDASFTWAFCDVVADRACHFCDSPSADLELKAAILVGLAQMASANHRYYVMRQFARRCGPAMDANLAERLQFEMQACGGEHLLKECVADLYDYSVSDYHPTLREIA